MPIADRLMHAWNAFMERDQSYQVRDIGMSSSYRPDRSRMFVGSERSIVTSVYNRIAMDCAAINVSHVRLDENGRFIEQMKSDLNNCLTLSANKDQTSRSFIQDVVMSMFDEGCVAIVPVDTTFNPRVGNSYDIQSMRTAKIIQWFPNHVDLRLYNDTSGTYEEIRMPKAAVAIIENPFYEIMNGQNSTVHRLTRKLSLLDAIDEQSGAGKMDLIIQLPYAAKSDLRKQQAEQRRKDIETQLAGSKYGIAYIDGTEHVTQLNRPVENNLMSQIEYLVNMFYSQLSITKEILEGTANDAVMQNYYTRTIEPIVSAITDEIKRKFLTKTARSQRQTIMFFRDPFKLVPVNQLADIADKFTRNEILTGNEVRQIVGLKPSNDPKADELRNKNISEGGGNEVPPAEGGAEQVPNEQTDAAEVDFS